MGPRDSHRLARMPLSRPFPAPAMTKRPMAEEAAAWAEVAPSFLEIGRSDALTDLDRILDDNDDVYIGLPSAAVADLSRAPPPERHGVARWPWRGRVDGRLLQEGQSAAFRIRNAARCADVAITTGAAQASTSCARR